MLRLLLLCVLVFAVSAIPQPTTCSVLLRGTLRGFENNAGNVDDANRNSLSLSLYHSKCNINNSSLASVLDVLAVDLGPLAVVCRPETQLERNEKMERERAQQAQEARQRQLDFEQWQSEQPPPYVAPQSEQERSEWQRKQWQQFQEFQRWRQQRLPPSNSTSSNATDFKCTSSYKMERVLYLKRVNYAELQVSEPQSHQHGQVTSSQPPLKVWWSTYEPIAVMKIISGLNALGFAVASSSRNRQSDRPGYTTFSDSFEYVLERTAINAVAIAN